MFFYWKGIIGFTKEMEAECREVIEALKASNFQSPRFEKLKGHDLWSARIGKGREKLRRRLLFTVVTLGDGEYLQFVEDTDHYRRSRVMNNPQSLERFREPESSPPATSSSTSATSADNWERVVNRDAFAGALSRSDGEAVPMHWHGDRPMVLTLRQEQAMRLQKPVLFTGLPGSGKTSTMLVMLPGLRADYPRIVCITRSPGLRNDMQSAWNAQPQAMEPGAEVTFLTYREWAESCGLEMSGKKEVGAQAFCDWYLQDAKSFAKRFGYKKIPTLLEPLKSSDRELVKLHRLEEAMAIYQEGRIASGCADAQAYGKLGRRLSTLGPESLERQFVWDIVMRGWVSVLAGSGRVDLSFIRLDPPVCGGLVLLDEVQDFSGAQLENAAKFAGPTLPLILCAGDFQRLSDPLPFTKPIRNLAHGAGRATGLRMAHVPLEGSYRVPLVLEAYMKCIIRLAIDDMGGLQEKRQVQTFKCAQGKHARPGQAFWLTWESMGEGLQQHLKTFATDNPRCVVITHEQYRLEAEKLFGEGVTVVTVEEVKGMQFEYGFLYRYFDTARSAKISMGLSGQQPSSSSATAHRPKHGLGKWENATAFNQIFTASSRFSEGVVFIDVEAPAYPAEALTATLRDTLPDCGVPEFTRGERDNSADAWQICVEQYIRQENVTRARALYMNRCNGTPEAFEALVERLQARVMPVMPVTPVIPEMPEVAIAARSCDPGPLPLDVPKEMPARKRTTAPSKRAVKPTQKPPADEAKCRERAAEIFSTSDPDNTATMRALLQDPDSVEDVRAYLTKPLNVLPYISAQDFGMQFNTDRPNAVGSSLLYWFFRLGDRRHHNFLLEVLQCNPGLVNEFAQFFKKMAGATTPLYDPRFADVQRMIHNHGMRFENSRVIPLLAKHARLNKPTELLLLVARHIPPECQEFCKELLRHPMDSWETRLNELDAYWHYWLRDLVVQFQTRMDVVREAWTKTPDKCLDKRIMRCLESLKKTVESTDLRPLSAELRQRLQNRRKVPQALAQINALLAEPAATPFHVGYVFLAAFRDILQTEGPAVRKTGFFGHAPSADNSVINIPNAQAFWRLAEAKTADGCSMLYQIMIDNNASREVINALCGLPQLIREMRLPQLLQPLAPVGFYGSCSLLAWLCEGDSVAHAILYDLLCAGKNPILSQLFHNALKSNVMEGKFILGLADLALLAKLEKTESGKLLLGELAAKLGKFPSFLVLKLHEYLPLELATHVRTAHRRLDEGWNRLLQIDALEDMQLRLTCGHLLVHARKQFAAMDSFGAQLWCGDSPFDFRLFEVRILQDLESLCPDDTFVEREGVVAVMDQLKALNHRSLMGVTGVFLDAIRGYAFSPLGRPAGYLRFVCRRFEPALRHLEKLSVCPPVDFWEKFHAIEWVADIRNFAQEDARLLFAANQQAEDFLQHATQDGLFTLESLTARPLQEVFNTLLQRVLETYPPGSLDHDYTLWLMGILEEHAGETSLEVFYNHVRTAIFHKNIELTGLFAGMMRMLNLKVEAILQEHPEMRDTTAGLLHI